MKTNLLPAKGMPDTARNRVWSLHAVDEVFLMIDYGNVRLHGVDFKLSSVRLKNFRQKGVVCVGCGVSGSVFLLESQGDCRPHFNLYAERPNGTFVMMTKDHILPRSKGGTDALENLQPMCKRCNGRKGNRTE